MASGDFKDWAKGTASDKGLRKKGYRIAKNSKYDRYQRNLASIICKFLIKSPKVVVLIMKLNKMNN